MSAQIALSTSPPPALALARSRSTVCCPAVSISCSRRRHRCSTPPCFFVRMLKASAAAAGGHGLRAVQSK
ncbi:hypothetical protein GALMADRAFT_254063 [Galerina marginata CBS 339.88]|uniref:Uncharacterized protein n=1 Tax=Galerina marginata (strain CBS 339.88) TaxID=685588 RepID=A0A067SU59_GALM3|nr:hypothetical protein GALMADRAFT_254063 [Galerina marginata CBS 339.88]